MGADIHGVLQERYGSGRWYTVEEIEDDRNYALFSALAGVRNYGSITPIAGPRGLPEDFEVVEGDSVKMDYKGYTVWLGDHSFSWLTIEELTAWDGWDQDMGDGETLRDYVATFLAWLKWADLKTGRLKEYERRIVFGFDS